MKTLIVDEPSTRWTALSARLALMAIKKNHQPTLPLHIEDRQAAFLQEYSMQSLPTTPSSTEATKDTPAMAPQRVTDLSKMPKFRRQPVSYSEARRQAKQEAHNNAQANRSADRAKKMAKRKATLAMQKRQRAVR